VRIHLAREHARELELRHALLEPRRLALQVAEASLVGVGLDEVEQFGRVGDAAADALQLVDRGGQAGTLATELLGPVGRIPDAGVLELAVQLFEAFALAVVLKDTPSARRGAARGP
jgi:hypothetical protein